MEDHHTLVCGVVVDIEIEASSQRTVLGKVLCQGGGNNLVSEGKRKSKLLARDGREITQLTGQRVYDRQTLRCVEDAHR